MLSNSGLLTNLTDVSALPGETLTPEIVPFQSYHVLKTTVLWLVLSSIIINQF